MDFLYAFESKRKENQNFNLINKKNFDRKSSKINIIDINYNILNIGIEYVIYNISKF